MDVYDEIGGNYFVFIFAYIFWTELHLASLDVVSSLNEARIEHDPANGFVREASMLEHYFNVALENQIPLLLLCQQENDSVLLLAVKLLGWVCELFSNVQATAAIHFEEGDAASG